MRDFEGEGEGEGEEFCGNNTRRRFMLEFWSQVVFGDFVIVGRNVSECCWDC